MSHETGLWDRLVNSKWPHSMPIPNEKEAIAGAKRLYKKAMGRPWRGAVKVTSGNRHTWVRRGTLVVNPNEVRWNGSGGWAEIVHSISHYAHWRLNPKDAPHSSKQSYIERDLTDYVIAQGWLEGKLKRPKHDASKKDIVSERYQRILARETIWEKKFKRAKNALAKARRERRAYEARHGERIVP
jgi:hypothetical protein